MWGLVCSESVSSICSDLPSICLKVAFGLFYGLSSSSHYPITSTHLRLSRAWGLKHTSLELSSVTGLKVMQIYTYIFFFPSLNCIEFFLSCDTTHHLVALPFNTVNCLPVSARKATLGQQISSVFTYVFFLQSPRSFQSVLTWFMEWGLKLTVTQAAWLSEQQCRTARHEVSQQKCYFDFAVLLILWLVCRILTSGVA